MIPKKLYYLEEPGRDDLLIKYCTQEAEMFGIGNNEYVSVEALKEWIDKQAEKNSKDIGAIAVLVKLETFLKKE